ELSTQMDSESQEQVEVHEVNWKEIANNQINRKQEELNETHGHLKDEIVHHEDEQQVIKQNIMDKDTIIEPQSNTYKTISLSSYLKDELKIIPESNLGSDELQEELPLELDQQAEEQVSQKTDLGDDTA